MKYHLLFLFSLIAGFISAQTDTVQLKDGRTFTGKGLLFKDRLMITDTSNATYMVTYSRLKAVSVEYELKHKGNNRLVRAYTIDSLQHNLHLQNWNSRQRHLQLAGEFGITGVAIMVGTTLGMGTLYGLERLGTIHLSPHQRTAIYSSLGIDCGIGLTLLIPAFIHIKKAGEVPEYRIP